MAKAAISLKSGQAARDAITEANMKEIKRLYEDAAKKVAAQAKALENKTNISSIIRTQYLADMEKKLQSEVKNISEQLNAMVKGGMATVAKGVVKDSAEWAAKAGMSVKGAWLNIPKQVVNSIASGQVYDNNWTLSKRIWGIEQKTLNDINKVVAQGVAMNMSAYDIAKDLEKYVSPSAAKDWKWSKVYPGVNKKVDFNAQRLSRTMVQHAYQQSFVATTKDNPWVDAYIWRSAMAPGRTCPICEDRDGQMYGVNELPMDHPMGLCTWTTYMSKNMNEITDDIAAWYKADEGTYPSIDKYAEKMMEKKATVAAVPNKIYVPKFSKLQEQYLTKYGYSMNNMPTSFSEWSWKLTGSDKQQLLDDIGAAGNSHPFQLLEKWYNQKLKYVKKTLVTEGSATATAPVKMAKAKVTPPKIKPTAAKAATSTSSSNSSSGSTFMGSSNFTASTKNEWQKMMENVKHAPEIRDVEGSSYYFNKKLSDRYVDWKAKVTVKEADGVTTYTGGAYSTMNRYLRGVDSTIKPERMKSLENARSALSKGTLGEDMIVRRGSDKISLKGLTGNIDKSDEWLENNYQSLIGTFAEDKGFMSTSPIIGGGFGSSGVEYRVFVPKDAQAMFVAPISQFKNEQEVIINAGTRFIVRHIELSSGTWSKEYTVYLEIIT